MINKLIFIYNADSGLYNTLTDIAHKIFSPETYSCNLCAISHSYLSEREEWKAFISELGVDCEFLHRDEFKKQYDFQVEAYPVVLKQEGNQLLLCLTADEINQCDSMETLTSAIKRCLSD